MSGRRTALLTFLNVARLSEAAEVRLHVHGGFAGRRGGRSGSPRAPAEQDEPLRAADADRGAGRRDRAARPRRDGLDELLRTLQSRPHLRVHRPSEPADAPAGTSSRPITTRPVTTSTDAGSIRMRSATPGPASSSRSRSGSGRVSTTRPCLLDRARRDLSRPSAKAPGAGPRGRAFPGAGAAEHRPQRRRGVPSSPRRAARKPASRSRPKRPRWCSASPPISSARADSTRRSRAGWQSSAGRPTTSRSCRASWSTSGARATEAQAKVDFHAGTASPGRGPADAVGVPRGGSARRPARRAVPRGPAARRCRRARRRSSRS